MVCKEMMVFVYEDGFYVDIMLVCLFKRDDRWMDGLAWMKCLF